MFDEEDTDQHLLYPMYKHVIQFLIDQLMRQDKYASQLRHAIVADSDGVME